MRKSSARPLNHNQALFGRAACLLGRHWTMRHRFERCDALPERVVHIVKPGQ
jgi:hypothetical protein